MRFPKICWVLGLVFLAGCSLGPDEKMEREQALKQTIESFVNSAVQQDWASVYKMSDGSVDGADKLKDGLMKTWTPDSTLTGGDITFMSWVNDTTAKVKINWAFQSGSVQSFSSETFVWGWNGNAWKYKGRAIR